MINRIKLCVFFVLFFPVFAYAAADGFYVSGKIERFTDANKKVYKVLFSDLLKMNKVSFKTSTNWTAREEFTGVPVKDVLDMISVKGSYLEVYCLDDYSYVIPIDEVVKHKAIFAYERNGT